MASNLFQKYGGFAVISKVVMAFYERAVDSDIIGGYFEGVDMRRLIDHQTKFISSRSTRNGRSLASLRHSALTKPRS